MIAVALAAVSAISYGASDFSGAVASKDNDATHVTLAMQVVSLASLLVILWWFPSGRLDMIDLGWGAIGGLGAAVGLVAFYRALARGPMSIAAALTALWSTALPVLAGLALGDRPGTVTLVGIAVAVPSAVLVSLESGTANRIEPTPRERVVAWQRQARTRLLAIVAGIGFGLFFIALSRTSADAGLYPLIGARVASVAGLTLAVLLPGRRDPAASLRLFGGIHPRWWPVIGLAGLLDCAANSLYLTALRHGSFTWVAAVSSLYPVATVLLARVVLNERLAPIQRVGLVSAGVALLLVGVGAS